MSSPEPLGRKNEQTFVSAYYPEKRGITLQAYVEGPSRFHVRDTERQLCALTEQEAPGTNHGPDQRNNKK